MKWWMLVLMGLLVLGLLSLITWWEFYAPRDVLVEQASIPQATPTPTITTITITAVGDVMLGRSVQEQMEKRNNFSWPFELTASKLNQTDITVGNLEAVIVPGCTQKENRFIFCAKPEAMGGLTMAGFDVLSQANNHSYNYGNEAYQQSIGLLREKGMEVTDPKRLAVKEIMGLKVGFLGYDDVSSPLDLKQLGEEIASASAAVDVLIPMVHWGIEYVNQPIPRQREVANVMVNKGADIIIGSHPHWTQPAERIGSAVVFWSLGNFVFDQMWSEETRQGEIAQISVTYEKSVIKTIDYSLVPVRIYDYGQPKISQQ